MTAFRDLAGPVLKNVAFAVGIGITLASGSCLAQCATTWQSTGGYHGLPPTVLATTAWDPDGPGPANEVVVFAGTFPSVGGMPFNRIAVWDPVANSFSALGGFDGDVLCLAVLPGGQLIAGGEFTGRIAQWNGSSWVPLGGGTSNRVDDLVVLPNGHLIAGGAFGSAGGVPASGIARWDGNAWSPLGSGLDSFVHAVTALPNGDVVAGGSFGNAGGTPASRIARWNGTSWQPMGSGMNGPYVFELITMPNGDVVAGGTFSLAGGTPANGMARWDGTSWSAMGTGINTPQAFGLLGNGTLVVGGLFQSAGGVAASNIATWNGAVWAPLGGGVNSVGVKALATRANGDLMVAGHFTAAGAIRADCVARWDGATWSPIGPAPGQFGITGTVTGIRVMAGGDVIAFGSFLIAGSVPANHIARWNGAAWTALGSGLNGVVFEVVELPNGDVVAGGAFTSAGGVPVNNIARWDGSAWHPLGAGTAGTVLCMVNMPNGDVVAAGWFTGAGGAPANRIARWNGSSWSALGSGLSTGPADAVRAMTVRHGGDLIVVGEFVSAGGLPVNNSARWDGVAWSWFGSLGAARVVEQLPRGDLLAGDWTGIVRRWNGTGWVPFGQALSGTNARVSALCELPDGDVLVGGVFTHAGGVPAPNIARWTGSAWQSVNGGLGGEAEDFGTLPNGDLIACGYFTSAGGLPAVSLARLQSNCPATASVLGAGCAGPGGTIVLQPMALPWLGGTFRARTTGMTANAIAFAVFGFATVSIPMSTLLPQGLPGCVLQVDPFFLELLTTQSGTADSRLVIPPSVANLGLGVLHQVVPLDLNLQNQVVALTASNPLTLLLGSF